MTSQKQLKQQTFTKRYPLRNKNTKLFVPNVKKLKNTKPKLSKRKLIKKPLKSLKKSNLPTKKITTKVQAKKSIKTHKKPSKLYERFSSPKRLFNIIEVKKQKNEEKLKVSQIKGAKVRVSIRIKQGKELQKLKKQGVIQEGRMRSFTKTKQYILKHFNKMPIVKRRRTDIPPTTSRSVKKSKSVPKIISTSKSPVIRVLPPKKNSTKKKNHFPPKSRGFGIKQSTSVSKIRVRKPIENIPVLPQMRRRIKKAAVVDNPLQPSEQPATSNVMINPFEEESRSISVEGRLKTLSELQRINRSRQQRIFLLSAQRGENGDWTFKVIGTQGQIYTVHIFTMASCTCFDYRSKRQPCKHIYFIITQIAQNESILEDFTEQGSITQSCFQELNECLFRRLKARIEGFKAGLQQGSQVKQIDLKDDKDCVICFTQMDQKQEQLDTCGTCKKYFHLQCLKSWRAHNNSCPLCRSAFEVVKAEIDPLQKFEELRI